MLACRVGMVRHAPPGSGLSAFERFVAGLGFDLLRAAFGRRRTEAWLRAETARVLAIARRLTPEQATRPVLVPHPFGLEDNSREWSPGMVVEHLVIVDNAFASVRQPRRGCKAVSERIHSTT